MREQPSAHQWEFNADPANFRGNDVKVHVFLNTFTVKRRSNGTWIRQRPYGFSIGQDRKMENSSVGGAGTGQDPIVKVRNVTVATFGHKLFLFTNLRLK